MRRLLLIHHTCAIRVSLTFNVHRGLHFQDRIELLTFLVNRVNIHSL